MEAKKSSEGTSVVFLDQLSLVPALQLFRSRDIRKIIILDPVKGKWQSFLVFLLHLRSISTEKAVFFSGNFKTDAGEGIPFFARKTAAHISFEAARQIVEECTLLAELNKAYGRETIRLFIAKKLHLVVEYWTHRILIAQKINNQSNTRIWLKNPDLFDGELILKHFPEQAIRFYKVTGRKSSRLIFAWLMATARSLKAYFGIGRHYTEHTLPEKNAVPSLLLFQENTNIRSDRRLRAQPHFWMKERNRTPPFNIYLIETRSFRHRLSKDDKLKIEQEGVTFLPMSVFGNITRKNKEKPGLSAIRYEKQKAARLFFFQEHYPGKYFALQVFFLLKQAEQIGALVSWLNIKVYLNREPQNSFSDAIQLVSARLNVTTIAYQYSNMGSISPMMMTTADRMLIFSDIYKKNYQAGGISPASFTATGYLYNSIGETVKNMADHHMEQLKKAGASFIICYFDETVETNRWGLVSKRDHLSELHALAEELIADPSIGLILKSQYMRNSPSQLYPRDSVIQKAKATGRYLELMEGIHRNEIYPAEAALSADICISHKFGATAGLEAAVVGVRTILLDTYGCTTIQDGIYGKADIIYKSIESVIGAIAKFRQGVPQYQAIGDWSGILREFDPFADKNAAGRIFDVIVDSFNRN